ncbi:MAG: hypothetical protein JXB48_21580 [Candidatus Latescibacteria bacterium]|nr:hypothetical protein [Candidatus Latescibacterota bacterium]
MIRYNIKNGQPVVEQIDSRPFIYFDNWMINLLLRAKELHDQFILILQQNNGTLLISDILITEIAQRSDAKQIERIGNFIDHINVAFIESNAHEVISREKELEKHHIPISEAKPWSGTKLLEMLETYAHNNFEEFKISELIYLLNQNIINNNIPEEKLEEELFPIIKQCRNDPEKLSIAKNRYRNRKNRIREKYPFTLDIYTQFVDYIVIQESMKMPDSEWRDTMQLVVPVAYCDYVVIDSRWKNFIAQSHLGYPDIAMVYSNKQIDDFLKDFQNYCQIRNHFQSHGRFR